MIFLPESRRAKGWARLTTWQITCVSQIKTAVDGIVIATKQIEVLGICPKASDLLPSSGNTASNGCRTAVKTLSGTVPIPGTISIRSRKYLALFAKKQMFFAKIARFKKYVFRQPVLDNDRCCGGVSAAEPFATGEGSGIIGRPGQIFGQMTRLMTERSELFDLRKRAGYTLQSLTIEAAELFSRVRGVFPAVPALPFPGVAVGVDNPAGLMVSKGFRRNLGGLRSLPVKNVA